MERLVDVAVKETEVRMLEAWRAYQEARGLLIHLSSREDVQPGDARRRAVLRLAERRANEVLLTAEAYAEAVELAKGPPGD